MSDTPTAGSEVKHVITLVHGTFAKGAAWTQSTSKLSRHFNEQLSGPVEIKIFDWSGRNRQDARQEGATALKLQLARQLTEFPNATHCIVAHSHGGNVALYALGDAALDKAIKAVFCLNTPFISVLKRNINNYRKLMRLLFVLMIIGALSMLVYAIADMAEDWMNIGKVDPVKEILKERGEEPAQGIWPESVRIPLKFIFVFVPFGLFWIGLRILSRLSRAPEVREGLIAQFKLPDLRSARVICLNNAGDEVGILFSMLAAIVHLPYIMCHYIVLRAFVWIALILAVLYLATFFAGLIPMGPYFFASLLGYVPEGIMRESALALITVAAIFSFLLLAIIIYGYWFVLIAYLVNALITHLPYGVSAPQVRDMFLVRLETTTVPVTSCLTEFHDLDRSSVGSLSHSTAYDDDEALRLISRRIRELSTSVAAPPTETMRSVP